MRLRFDHLLEQRLSALGVKVAHARERFHISPRSFGIRGKGNLNDFGILGSDLASSEFLTNLHAHLRDKSGDLHFSALGGHGAEQLACGCTFETKVETDLPVAKREIGAKQHVVTSDTGANFA